MPARASFSPRFSALVRPFLRIAVSALSKSPLVSSSALLASVSPTPVRSLRRFTAAISTAITLLLFSFFFSFFWFLCLGFSCNFFGIFLSLIDRLFSRGLACFYGMLHIIHNKLDGLYGVVVRRNWVGYQSRVNIGVDHGNDRHTKFGSFTYSVFVMQNINDKNCARLFVQFLNAAIQHVHLIDFFLKSLNFKLVVLVSKFTAGHSVFKILQIFNPPANSSPVGEHTTEPTFSDIRHAGCFCCFAHNILGLAFSTDEKDLFTFTRCFCYK